MLDTTSTMTSKEPLLPTNDVTNNVTSTPLPTHTIDKHGELTEAKTIEQKIMEIENVSGLRRPFRWIHEQCKVIKLAFKAGKLVKDLERLNHFQGMYEKYHIKILDASPVKKIALLYDLAKQFEELERGSVTREVYRDFASKVKAHFHGGATCQELEDAMTWLKNLNATNIENIPAIMDVYKKLDDKSRTDVSKWKVIHVGMAEDVICVVREDPKNEKPKSEEIREKFLAHKQVHDAFCRYISQSLHHRKQKDEKRDEDGNLLPDGFMVRWFLDSLEMSAAQQKCSFLNRDRKLTDLFPSQKQNYLPWTILGWKLNQLYNDEVLASQSMYTNMTFAVEMDELGTKVMSDFGVKLSKLKGVVINKIDDVNNFRSRALAICVTGVVGGLQLFLSHSLRKYFDEHKGIHNALELDANHTFFY